eukprot:c31462_g1_i1 orf=4-189(-)
MASLIKASFTLLVKLQHNGILYQSKLQGLLGIIDAVSKKDSGLPQSWYNHSLLASSGRESS